MSQIKDSGIGWIGEIPEEWNIKKFKYIAKLYTGNSISDEEKYLYESNVNELSYPYVSTKDVNLNTKTVNYDSGMRIDMNNRKFRIANPGDTILCIEGGSAGKKMAQINQKICFVNKLCAMHAEKDILDDWINLYVQSDSFAKEFSLNMSGMIGGVSLFDLKNFSIVVPPLNEQKLISKFLKEKTSKLDEAIKSAKNEIDLLNQLKRNIIRKTVTKGLEQNPNLKYSGVDWIGKIPQNWAVKKLRYLGTLQNGISKDGGSFGSGYPFVSYGDVYNNFVLPTQVDGLVESTSSERKLFSVEKGDIFFTRTSETAEEIGLVSTCFESIENATFAGFLIRFRPGSNTLDRNFSKYYFISDILRKFFVKEMMVVTRASLGQNLLKNLSVVLPPLETQKEIANYLDNTIGEIDKIISTLESTILISKDTKKSLIYEYVTGKKRVEA
ncbi:restriction endonuclease subunit S [Leuconostoc falkenbergense]|uniref:restriction endonuclease subunit S n=1 Tax=Leuconostoc falkenbergense TaxID=2766470 RepID=UPI0016646DD5|nr:restriction endonuclease subunit S [Leuconostoc falkenbergense]